MKIESPAQDLAMPQPPAPRFLALDVFRGLAVCLMIVVNTPGAGAAPYPWLVHARWFGFTAADWVFPAFLFAVGCAMAFAFRRPATGPAFAAKVLKRAGLIFLLGFLMYWYPFVHKEGGAWQLMPFADTRVMGVLQRIALCYLLAAFAVRYLTPWRLVALSVLLLVGYWWILLAFGDPADPRTRHLVDGVAAAEHLQLRADRQAADLGPLVLAAGPRDHELHGRAVADG